MTEETKQPEEQDLMFKLPTDNVFPTELFEGKSYNEIEEILKDFIIIQDKEVFTTRILTKEEISEIRRIYGDIAEDNLPTLRLELETLIQEHKIAKELLQDRITSMNTQFLDLVAEAKNGIREYKPLSDRTFRIPVSGHYLIYTYTGTKFQLARVQQIPDSERYDLFNSGDKNKEMFAEHGYEFPDNPVLNKQNYRVIGDDPDEYVEVWEVDGKDVGSKHWKEALLDENTGEVIDISRKERIEIPIEESPYQNEPIEAQEGETIELQEEPEE